MSEAPQYCSSEVAQKVMYEFGMFRFLCDRVEALSMEAATFQPGDVTYCGTGATDDENDRVTFALLESLLLHTRVLHDFFYKTELTMMWSRKTSCPIGSGYVHQITSISEMVIEKRGSIKLLLTSR